MEKLRVQQELMNEKMKNKRQGFKKYLHFIYRIGRMIMAKYLSKEEVKTKIIIKDINEDEQERIKYFF